MVDIWQLAKGHRHGQRNIVAWMDIKQAAMAALKLTSPARLPNIWELEEKYKDKVESELIKMRLKDG